MGLFYAVLLTFLIVSSQYNTLGQSQSLAIKIASFSLADDLLGLFRLRCQFYADKEIIGRNNMMVLLALQNYCSFISLWLFTIKYYETALDIDCLVRKSDLIKNKKDKRCMKYTVGTIMCFSLFCYIPFDISMYLTEEDDELNTWQDILIVMIVVASMAFLFSISIMLTLACYKLVKLVQISNKEQTNHVIIFIQMLAIVTWALSCCGWVLNSLLNARNFFSSENL